MQRQSELILRYAEVGEIDSESLYDLLTIKKGAKEARIALLRYPLAASVPLLQYSFGTAAVELAISPILTGIALRRRLLMWQHMRRRDIAIVDTPAIRMSPG